jgi:hypothetical protein
MKFKFGYILLYLVFLTMGFAALIGGTVILYKNIDLKSSGVPTTALIIGAADHSSNFGRKTIGGDYRKENDFFPVLNILLMGKKFNLRLIPPLTMNR